MQRWRTKSSFRKHLTSDEHCFVIGENNLDSNNNGISKKTGKIDDPKNNDVCKEE